MMATIYQIANKANDKLYIGSTKNPALNRWRTHLNDIRRKKHPNKHLQRAFAKYGESQFEFKILLICENNKQLYYEQWFLDNLNPSYNICKIAGVVNFWKGKSHSEETKRKISETKKKNPHRLTEVEKQHLREINIGKELSPEFIAMQGSGKKRWTSKRLQGERNFNSKLAKQDVLEIRRQLLANEANRVELSKIFNVSYCCIYDISVRKTWKHI